MKLGNRIRKLREDNKLSQNQLGEKLGVKFSAVSKWERDETVPPLKQIAKMIKIFDTTYDEFFEDIDF